MERVMKCEKYRAGTQCDVIKDVSCVRVEFVHEELLKLFDSVLLSNVCLRLLIFVRTQIEVKIHLSCYEECLIKTCT
jgi:hypothetical protein